MKIELMRDLYDTNNRLVLAKGEVFKVKESVNRFNNKCYEVVDGDEEGHKEGYLLAISDCKIIE